MKSYESEARATSEAEEGRREEVQSSLRHQPAYVADDVAIRVQNLSKCYQLYDRPEDRLKQAISPRLRRLIGMEPKSYAREFWALRNVSFEVKKGETVGIIGRNGSGKSTLLKMICGTLNSTSGNIQTSGRVAALLELGTGFNPEFTGRENVYMNGAILGLNKEEVDARFDDIAAFADIGQFIDHPVKTYSSGMYMRLAFASAISVEPQILVVDEALAVGDFDFTLKCLSRIDDIKAKGSSILFVSHDVALVQKLSDRVLYLHMGEPVAFGDPASACSRYITSMTASIKDGTDPSGHGAGISASTTCHETNNWPTAAAEAAFAATVCGHRTGDGDAKITLVTLRTAGSRNFVNFGETVEVKIFLRVHRPVKHLCVSMYVIDEAGLLLLGTNTNYEGIMFPDLLPNDRIQVNFGFENRLRDGEYGITTIASTFFSPVSNEYLDYIEPATRFQATSASGVTRWAIHNPPFDLRCIVNGSDLGA